MSFPTHHYGSAKSYLDDYAAQITRAYSSIDGTALEKAAALILDAINRDKQIFSCGNGGSAAISNHLVCDHVKSVSTNTGLLPRIQSLSACVEIITAVANDDSYAEVFRYQLSRAARPGDVLIAISSSGDSENIVRAITWAKEHGLATIALTGFKGGRVHTMVDISLYINAQNYGVIEDIHQSIMHILAQYIRQLRMDTGLIGQVKF